MLPPTIKESFQLLKQLYHLMTVNANLVRTISTNWPKNQSQETSNETEIADPGEEVAETADEIDNIWEALPEQEKSTPPDPNLLNELYDQFKLKECDDYQFLRIADQYFKEGTLTLKAIYLI